MDINKEFYSKLSDDKINISWNKNPIRMKVFLSFLDIMLIRSSDHLGYSTGWTLRFNKEINLWIKGGIVCGIEYLDSIEFEKNLSNPYNNFVNPFYLWDLFNNEGRRFFIDYYEKDINEIVSKITNAIEYTQSELLALKEIYKGLNKEVEMLQCNSRN